jgi:hypothetical protein
MTDHDPLLAIALQAAVPLAIAELAALPPARRAEQMAAWRTAGVEAVAHRGDILQYGGGKKGQVADTFTALARGLAVLAHAPGGVAFHGTHWCTEHPGGTAPDNLTCSTDGWPDPDADQHPGARHTTTAQPRQDLL